MNKYITYLSIIIYIICIILLINITFKSNELMNHDISNVA